MGCNTVAQRSRQMRSECEWEVRYTVGNNGDRGLGTLSQPFDALRNVKIKHFVGYPSGIVEVRLPTQTFEDSFSECAISQFDDS